MKKNLLTHKQVTSAASTNKVYSLRDGGGLILRVMPTGAKNWILEYKRPDGRRSSTGLGGFPSVGLAEARSLAHEFRNKVGQGIDVVLEHKKVRAAQINEINTFKEVALVWMEFKRHSVTSDHLVDIRRRLEMHVFPTIGSIAIKELTAPLAISALRQLERQGKMETLKRVIQIINQVMRYAINSGLIEHNRLADISDIFPAPNKVPMRAISPEYLEEFLADVEKVSCHERVRQLLYFQLATMLRPSEAAAVEWSWIDLEAKTLTIPAESMKMKREHRVPLSPGVIKLLQSVIPHKASRFVFFGIKNPREHINSQTVNAVVRRTGWGDRLVSHGFRSIASTYLNQKGFNPDWIEAALAHVDENEVRRAYNRSDYFDQRHELMNEWSKKCLTSQ